jgi:hypothetical protein
MSMMRIGRRTALCSQDTNALHACHCGFRSTATLIVLMLLVIGGWCPPLHAQSSNMDAGSPSMSNVTDVTPGWKYLLQNDDLAMVQVNTNSGVTSTSLLSMNTSKSALSGTQLNIPVANSTIPSSVDTTNSSLAAEAAGRMFNTNTDAVGMLYVYGSEWAFSVINSTGVQASTKLNASFAPNGTVRTQVVMGDFTGDGLADPVAFYTDTNINGSSDVKWGMIAITAADSTKPWNFRVGPELGGDALAPVAGTIVVGDFNGDGRDEIAALLNDYQTIAFYSIDPTTLAITQTTTVKLTAAIPLIGNFPVVLTAGQVALVAGKFRQCGGNGNPCQANVVSNADVVVFGQISQINGNSAAAGYSVIPIAVTPNPGGTPPFKATVVPMKSPTEDHPFFRFPSRPSSIGALAQAAPLAYWPQQTDEQLVLGIKCGDTYAASYIEIGSFLPDDGALDTFDWESETERKYELQSDHLENMWVGNFDHQNPDGSHNAVWQIETYELVGYVNSYDAHINIFNVNVPSPFPSNPPKRTDWLSGQQQSDNTSNVPFANPDTPSLGFLVPSDMQGRSLRLGAPTIVRIPIQIQPDLVLAIPPMHVDYIAPNDLKLAGENKAGGCTDDLSTPCVVNLSVKPSLLPSVGQGFATSFNFTSNSNSSSKRSSTTSWGVSTKTSVGESSTFNDGLENASESIKDTTKTGHDATVKKTYGTYDGTTQTLSATTGLSDYLYFTQKAMNVYYYPVLGCDTAGAAGCWVDGQKVPMYVQFSVPDQVRYSDIDGLTQDWYQPVHEPGNIFSYPWSLTELQAQYAEQVNTLTGPATCMATGNSNSTYSTQWRSGHSQDSSSGSTSTFSNELSMSYSEGAGVKGVDAANFNFSMDVAASTSLNTLNESSTSMSTSKAISVNIPSFGRAATCCNYAFGAFVFGLKNSENPASEVACTAGQTPDKNGCTSVNDPDNGKPIDIAGTGPMFVGFLADPVSGRDKENTYLTCSGSDSWWINEYTLPDIGVNHPGRWNWNKSEGTGGVASFTTADSTPIVEDNYFYLMKGFFISKKGNTNGPTLAEASPSDPLTLSARVYNYSLANTTAPVHVRFYGQLYCTSSGSGETSCQNGNSTCTFGLCGNGFQIGSDQIIPSIPGFKAAGTEPNWTTAGVDFDPGSIAATKNGNANMVFWVVTWMEDSSGHLAAEMPGHGLKSIPAANLTQITQVPFEPYSNNVGMYGVHQPFYICPTSGCAPQNAGLGSTPSGSLKSINLSTNPQLSFEQRSKLSATLQAANGPVGPVNIAYYDGNPAKGGVLVDVQHIDHMDPGATYSHRAFFTPETCGAHTLYASAWIANSPEIQSSTTTSVTIDSVSFVQALINSTEAANVTDVQLSGTLLGLLHTALQDFQQGHVEAGNTALGAFLQQLAIASGNGIDATSVNQLTGQTGTVLGCGSSGFSLSASPSSATVSVGNIASYAVAITPTGGFNGKISLSCVNVPQGTDCSFTSQTVTLDGVTQSRVTVTVTTTGRSAAAGIGGPPPSGSGRIWWLLMLLLGIFSILLLQRARLRYKVLNCVILLVLLSNAIGCGGRRNTASTPPGAYTLFVQATSGNTVQNTALTLVVK